MAEELVDVGGGVTLCHERFGDPADPAVVLVMGLGTQMLGWHEDFCEGLAARGFHVVRFDNRDIGRSTHLRHVPPPRLDQLLLRRFHPEQYDLGAMAQDTAGLIRALDLCPVHVVGASMGGMIAQTLAARHPDLVASLVSIMSMTGSRVAGQPAPTMYPYLLRPAPRDREAYAEHVAKIFAVIGTQELPADREEVLERGRRSFDRGRDPAGPGRQLAAILKSGNRTRELRGIRVPTLVVHGTAARRARDGAGDPGRRARPRRGHGPRPSAGPLAPLLRRHRAHGAPGRRPRGPGVG
jgi:pimeloyl-ACP methyl ester carboxylesterase